jgi:hypothetical protein
MNYFKCANCEFSKQLPDSFSTGKLMCPKCKAISIWSKKPDPSPEPHLGNDDSNARQLIAGVGWVLVVFFLIAFWYFMVSREHGDQNAFTYFWVSFGALGLGAVMLALASVVRLLVSINNKAALTARYTQETCKLLFDQNDRQNSLKSSKEIGE